MASFAPASFEPKDEGQPSQRACPHCGSARVFRRRRRTFTERLASLRGLYPYQCEECERAFTDRRTLQATHEKVNRDLRWARCPKCRSTEIDRIAREYVPQRWSNLLWRIARVPSYRCPGCREKFFAFRQRKKDDASARHARHSDAHHADAARNADSESGKELNST